MQGNIRRYKLMEYNNETEVKPYSSHKKLFNFRFNVLMKLILNK